MSVAELRSAFTARYHSFKLLLNANNEALEAMVEIEEALRGGRSFSMSFVNSVCTRAAKSVFQIITHLNNLAPGEYESLSAPFRKIQNQIHMSIQPRVRERTGPLLLSLAESHGGLSDLVGPKMAGLGDLKNRLHVKTPDGFVITSEAYYRFLGESPLQDEVNRLVQSAGLEGVGNEKTDALFRLSSSVQQLIIEAPLPSEVEESILAGYARLKASEGRNVNVAVRSSALGEDLGGTSFAGLFKSILNIGVENLCRTYKEVLASKYSLQAMAYRLARGIRDEDVAMCVGFLTMVDARVGGVAYTRSPVDPADDRITLHSAWGLPRAVVDGSADTDFFLVSRHGELDIVEREVAAKGVRFVCMPGEGVSRKEFTADEGEKPSLTDDQVRELARLSLSLEENYGSAVDVEWAIGPDGGIQVLQCRPLSCTDAGTVVGGGDSDRPAGAVADRQSVIISGGVSASSGAASGPVYPIRKDADLLGFPEGGVLVVLQAVPRWAALLGRASAVVAEMGGVAGHLATVAREFRVPAIFGLKGAMDNLVPGEIVTVDAGSVTLHRGRREELLTEQPKTDRMAGSPVYKSLEDAARLIVKLNLLDPESPDFKPAHCKTLHDITRFCHEKSVTEMFRFGTDQDYPQAAAKQLVREVPMQFWIVNLDDGFTEEIAGKTVNLEQITSIPMLALWKGIEAKPWSGPPPVNARGFASVLFEATANPDLNPSMGSRFSIKNYFTISRNYCSLQSRFGFHFCGVEALVSERTGENYVSFQFKGGAADRVRRVRRAGFVASLLEDYDFRTTVREDSVVARIEGFEREFMERRLNILGYLIIHTRQLDMIMGDSASVARHREEIDKDIRELFALR